MILAGMYLFYHSIKRSVYYFKRIYQLVLTPESRPDEIDPGDTVKCRGRAVPLNDDTLDSIFSDREALGIQLSAQTRKNTGQGVTYWVTLYSEFHSVSFDLQTGNGTIRLEPDQPDTEIDSSNSTRETIETLDGFPEYFRGFARRAHDELSDKYDSPTDMAFLEETIFPGDEIMVYGQVEKNRSMEGENIRMMTTYSPGGILFKDTWSILGWSVGIAVGATLVIGLSYALMIPFL